MMTILHAYPAWRDEENHEKPQPGLTMSLPRLEQSTSRMETYSLTAKPNFSVEQEKKWKTRKKGK
jgi:hypothetical protein